MKTELENIPISVMTEEEKVNLVKVQQAANAFRAEAYSFLKLLTESNEFSIYGYESLVDALKGTIKDTEKSINRLYRNHESKYKHIGEIK